MKNVLIIDDEKSFLHNLFDGLSAYAGDFNVLTSENGPGAKDMLMAANVDLVITDLKMPLMKGFELLDFMSKNHPAVPVIVTTAFWSPELEEKLQSIGIQNCLRKPLEFDVLVNKIFEQLALDAKGYIRGIGLPSFLQLVEMEKKTYTLTVRSNEKAGQLYFLKGKLMDAQTKNLQGEKAAYEIIGWDPVEIEIEEACKKNIDNISSSLTRILLEGLRLKDEHHPGSEAENESSAREADEKKSLLPEEVKEPDQFSFSPDKNIPALQQKLKKLTAMDSLVGAGIFTPAGEPLVTMAIDKQINMKELGALANTVLLSAQQTSRNMNAGRSQFVYVEAEKAHILVRCYNEGTDPLQSQPGKAHIHLVLVLDSEASIGMGKLRINKVIESLAEDFRSQSPVGISQIINMGAN